MTIQCIVIIVIVILEYFYNYHSHRLYPRASKGSTSRTVDQPALLQGEELQNP